MKKMIAILLLMAMLIGMVAGCSSEEPTAGPADGGSASKVEEPAKKDENVFVFSRSATINNFDPQVSYTKGIAILLFNHFYENLVSADYETGTYTPELATSWETSEDGLTWTFHLREGVTYTDGNPFGSDDVKAVFDRTFREEKCSAYADCWECVESYECPDEYTFVLKLNKPLTAIMDVLAEMSIWSSERYEQYGEDMFNFDDTMKPVGTGAFIPDKWTVGGDIEFVRNPDWWGIDVLGKESNVDRFIYRPLTEEATRIAGIQTGDLDFVTNITPEYVDLLSNTKGVKVDTLTSSQFIYMLFATDRGVFQDENARWAAHYAIDRQLIADSIAGGGKAANWLCPDSVAGYDADVPVPPQDMDKAREYLSKSSYNGESIVLLGTNGLFERSKEVYQAVASMLTEAGFVVELQVLDTATVKTMRANKEYDLYITNVILGDTPEVFIKRWYLDTFKGGYYDEEMWPMIESAMFNASQEESAKYYHDVMEMAIEKCAPVLGLYQCDAIVAYGDDVTDWEYFSGKNYFNFSHVQKGQ